ncbi:MAG: cytochrome C [Epsilonproteobacteria bacterium]|nr:MAG: cytochrome C [Campylobacterota bacterium]
MKRVISTFLLLIAFGFAEDYTQAKRILDMQKMAQAMQDIQSGFFYNNLDIVKAGARDLKETIVKIGPTKEEIGSKDVYERWMNNNTAMTKRTQRNIERKSDVIVKRFSDGDATQALQVYAKISSECMKCHVSLRKW